jgi:K+-transporting ATPase KdpF subunit
VLGLDRALRPAVRKIRRFVVTGLYIIGAIVGFGLFVYLIVAILKPEKFS